MNWLLKLVAKSKEEQPKTADDHAREALVDSGKEQFTKILDMGLKIQEVSL